MKNKILLLIIVALLPTLSSSAQQSKWIIGGGEADTNLIWNNFGPNNLKFFQIDFSTTTPIAIQRTTGNSINSINSYGTMDPSVCYFDKLGNLKFYVFSAAQTLANGNFYTAPGDSFYIAEYNSSTGKDEVVVSFPTSQFGSSVVDMEIVRKNCSENSEEPSPDEYFIIYKTRAASAVNDEIKYVKYNFTNKTLSLPINISSNNFHGEGMAISPYSYQSKCNYLIFTVVDTILNSLIIYESAVSSNGISSPISIDTIIYQFPIFNTIPCSIEFTNKGDKMALSNFNPNSSIDDILLYDFNINLGDVSNRITINDLAGETGAVEFSNDGKKLFVMQLTGGFNQPYLFYCDVPTHDTILDFSPYIDLTNYQHYGCFHIQKAFDKNLYINPGYGSQTLIKIANIDSLTPSISTLGNNFFGLNNWAGTDLPEQIDGLDYSWSNCYPQGIFKIDENQCSLNKVNYTSENLFVNDLSNFLNCGEIYSIQLYDFLGRLISSDNTINELGSEMQKIENKNLVYSIIYKNKSSNTIQSVSGKLFLIH